MKRSSVKVRITLWLTLLTLLLSGLVLAFMLSVSSAVAQRTAQEQLSRTVRNNLSQVSAPGGSLALGEAFHFYRSGVSTLIYSRNQSLLAGQLPVSFTADEPFQSGLIRTVDTGDSRYLVLDLWLPLDWEEGLWVRGLMEAPDSRQTAVNLLLVALIALPLFILLAALGSYLILRRAFLPLDSINATAAAINEASDLSRRIGLPRGRDEFSRLAGTFDALFARLERAFEAEKQFTADASHELRTPVSVIKGACEYAWKYDETEEERRETLTMIHRQAEKMTVLIDRLLSMTRLDQGIEQAQFIPVDLTELAGDVCRERQLPPETLTLQARETVAVRGDPDLLRRLLDNLLDNAFKYGRPKGTVQVTVSGRDGEVLLQVRDDGMGIPPEEQEKIWQRFYQVDPARSGQKGVGLGLSMVRQIARLHGGYMTLESTPGEGSTFTLHLPEAGKD